MKRESVSLQRLIVLNNVDIDAGITGSGPTKPVVEAYSANSSAFSLAATPQWTDSHIIESCL